METAYVAEDWNPVLPFYVGFQESGVSSSMHYVAGYIRKVYNPSYGDLNITYTSDDDGYKKYLSFSIENSFIKITCTFKNGFVRFSFI